MTQAIQAAVDDRAKQLISSAETFVKRIESMLVRTPREYEQAAEALKAVKGKYNEIESDRVRLKEPILEAGRRIDELFRGPLQMLKNGETALKKLQTDYQLEQQRIAKAEQARLDEEARIAREALETEARRKREEADREAAALRAKAEAQRKAGKDIEANILVAKAINVEHSSEDEAQEILTQASQVVAPTAHVEVPIVQGQSMRTIWRARVTDAALVPDMFKVVDDKLIQDFARNTKGEKPIPGLSFYPEHSLSSRTK